MTIFACYFSTEVVARIWDVYFVEGRKTIFRISLAILKINEKELLEGNMMDMK
jgi:TBC1 domain family member 10